MKSKAVICPICDTPIPTGIKGRSVPQLRRYMVLMREAWKHWPDGHEYQFDDWNQLRKWLQMKAGWREVAARFPMKMPPAERRRMLNLLRLSLAVGGEFLWPVATPTEIILWRPKSIAFHAMDHDEVGDLIHAVEELLPEEMGVTAEELMQARESET